MLTLALLVIGFVVNRAGKIFCAGNNFLPDPDPSQVSPLKQKPISPTLACSEAFSLAELLIAIVIVGLLIGVTTVNIQRYQINTKRDAARQDIATIMLALDSFWTEHGRFPSTDEGLGVLTRAREDSIEPIYDQNQQGLDPWGQPYRYRKSAEDIAYTLMCLGADSQSGGDGANADISSKDIE